MIGHGFARRSVGVATVLVAALTVLTGLTGPVSTDALASIDTTPPGAFDIVPDAGDYQTGFVVAAPYSNIYVTWQSTTDETSAVTYEVTVDDVVVRVVADVEVYQSITKRIEVPEGTHIVAIIAIDAAGNRQMATHSLDVTIDKVSPTFTSFPLLVLRRGKVTDDGYPMRYTWTGTDVGTGLSTVRIGPNQECCYTTAASSTSYNFTVAPESSVAWRLWLYDGVGRSTHTQRDGYVSQSPRSATDRSDSWHKHSDALAMDGTEWVSTSTGGRFKTTVSGRSVAWVATTGPTRGRADVLLNGRVVDTVSLYSAKRVHQRVVWAGKLPLGTSSTVSIINRSGKQRPMIGVDALLLQR